jgi:hypothetical protein
MVTTSATRATASSTSHDSNNATIARPAENTTTHHPGPFPILPPAKTQRDRQDGSRDRARGAAIAPLDDVVSRAETDEGKTPHRDADPQSAEEEIEQEISQIVAHIVRRYRLQDSNQHPERNERRWPRTPLVRRPTWDELYGVRGHG